MICRYNLDPPINSSHPNTNTRILSFIHTKSHSHVNNDMIIIIIIDEFQERKNFISFLDDPIDMFLLNIEVPYCPSQTFHLREDI